MKLQNYSAPVNVLLKGVCVTLGCLLQVFILIYPMNILDSLITDIQRDFPNVDYKRVTGLLRARGVYLQQARIRQSMRRVDPEGILL